MDDLDPHVRQMLEQVSSASLSNQLAKRGLRNTAVRGVRPMGTPSKPMIGPAWTMRYIPAREDIDGTQYSSSPDNWQRRAIDTVPEGAVLIMDCRGVVDTAGIGAVLVRRLVFRRAAGLVLDGGVRDTADIARLGLPTFGAGPAAPANFVSHHASDMGQPIACGGVAVYPGDIVFGDEEAVIIIPRSLVAEVAQEALEMEEQEVFLKGEIEAGHSTFGVYPPNAETLERYQTWRAQQKSEEMA